MENSAWVSAPVMCGTAAGGPVCVIVRRIARPFMSWSDTTPTPSVRRESSSDADHFSVGGTVLWRGCSKNQPCSGSRGWGHEGCLYNHKKSSGVVPRRRQVKLPQVVASLGCRGRLL